jgi:RNA polymerase sigma-70 factor (ECF subfamily)
MGAGRGPHKVIDHYRKATRDNRRMSLVAAGSADVDEMQPLADHEPAAIVHALTGLSAEHRLVLVLKYLDDLSVAKIAATLGKSPQAVESLLARARRALVRGVQEAAS